MRVSPAILTLWITILLCLMTLVLRGTPFRVKSQEPVSETIHAETGERIILRWSPVPGVIGYTVTQGDDAIWTTANTETGINIPAREWNPDAKHRVYPVYRREQDGD
jgi:hypothetical protein